MAITNYLVHFKTEATFNANKSQLRPDAVAFVGDATIIHTHETDYYCGSGPVALESDLANYATTSALTSGLAGKANTSHTHSISQISGLQGELDSKLESVSLADLGVTATATELNYCDGVTSNIQTQLNGKAASSHTHTASQVTGLADVATSGSYNDLSDKPEFPDVSELATKSELSNYLPLTGGTLTGVLTLNGNSSGNVIELDNGNTQSFNIVSNNGKSVNIKALATSLSVTETGVVIGGNSNDLITLQGTGKAQRISSTSPISIACWSNELKISDATDGLTFNDYVVLTEDNYSNYITSTDTKNTAGSSNSTSKLFLIGASSQSPTGVQTYSNSDVYMQDGNLLLKTGDLSVSNSGTLFGGKLNIHSGIFLVNDEQVTFNPAGSDTFSLFYNDGISLTLNDSIGSFTVNGGVGTFSDKVNATNGFYETSDARLKNFKDDIKALDVISEIPTKYFTWKKDETDDPKLHIGTSAQEIQKVYPDLVSENEEGELSVDYARLSVIALAAIKELKKEINELKFIKMGGGLNNSLNI